MESQSAAFSHAAFGIQREKEGIGEKRDVQRIGAEPSGINFIRYDVENLLVEELVQKEDCNVAVAGFF